MLYSLPMLFPMIFNTLLAALVSVSVYGITVAVYRLTFHPLAKYPGPWSAKISHWDQVYHAWKGDRHLEFYRCHEKYGPVYRYGPNNLSFNTNTALQTIYGHKSNVRKSQFYSVFPAEKTAFSTHSAIDLHAHARKRRVISHAFSDSAIKTMEKYILTHVREFCDRLGEKGTPKATSQSSINISDWCDYLTFDILGDLCFGKAFGMLERSDNRFAVDLIGNAAKRHLICGCFPILHELHLDKVLFRKIASGRERYMKYSKSQAVERTKTGLDVDRKDFFYYLLNAKDSETGKGFSMSELWGESNLLLIAGSDTTSTSLAATFFYLVHNLSVLKKLQHEIVETFGGVENYEEICSGPKLNACVYLRACIDEAMRMSPPVGGLLPREVLAGGFEIDGHHIDAGTDVGVPTYAIHHNESYFPKPFEYVPERWLSGSEAESLSPTTAENVTLAKSAFCPFSVGPRGCIGKSLAYTELLITVARTLCLYDLKMAEGERTGGGSRYGEIGRRRPGELQLWDTFTSKKSPVVVEFSPRRIQS